VCMRNTKLIVFIGLLLILGSGIWGQSGIIEYSEGRVTVIRGITNQRVSVDIGTPVQPGDRVITGPGALVIMTFAQGSQVKLRENSEITLDTIEGQGAVSLNAGSLFARATPQSRSSAQRLEIRTLSAVAGVRGTEFFVAYGPTVPGTPNLWLCVNTGVVEVQINDDPTKSTDVNAGEGILVRPTELTEPQFYAWTENLNWNFSPTAGEVVDNTGVGL